LVRVVDGKGCEASLEIPIEFFDIEVPNFFTPDDDGYKDKWIIKNSKAFPNIYVRIYGRYGRSIKEFRVQGEWNGSYNKVDLPTGEYWYVIKLNGPNDRREFVGNDTVYRDNRTEKSTEIWCFFCTKTFLIYFYQNRTVITVFCLR